MNIKNLIPKISEEEMPPLVIRLLEINQLLMEQVQDLKDEIARLKGQKPRPEIKPSSITKEDSNKQERGKRNSGGARRAKTKGIRIQQDITIAPVNIPPGSKFIDYRDYIVQDIRLFAWNIRYRRERWQTPSGEYITGELPEDVKRHFGSDLKSFVLYQYYGCYITEPLLA